jgi:tetratricopeptide (TPR) repeat protein
MSPAGSRTRRVVAYLVLAGSLATASNTARASDRDPDHRWAFLLEPTLRRTEEDFVRAELALVQAARLRRTAAAEGQSTLLARPWIERARDSLANVVARAPTLVRARVDLATAYDWLGQYPESLEQLERARSLVGQGPECADVLFELGIAYTRLERFTDARDVYEQYVLLPVPSPARGVGMCNLAEIVGQTGDTSRAIDIFRECIAMRPGEPSALWGLAVVSDRDGREDESHRAAMDALAQDPELAGIRGPDVFFVPAYEVHYYLALAHEARGVWTEAASEWLTFLSQGGEHSRWSDRARAHLALATRRSSAAQNAAGSARRVVRAH